MICQRYAYTEGSIDESFFNETLSLHRRPTPPLPTPLVFCNILLNIHNKFTNSYFPFW